MRIGLTLLRRIYEQTLALGLSVDDPKAFADCIAKALT